MASVEKKGRKIWSENKIKTLLDLDEARPYLWDNLVEVLERQNVNIPLMSCRRVCGGLITMCLPSTAPMALGKFHSPSNSAAIFSRAFSSRGSEM